MDPHICPIQKYKLDNVSPADGSNEPKHVAILYKIVSPINSVTHIEM
jgi:hypothetical protein